MLFEQANTDLMVPPSETTSFPEVTAMRILKSISAQLTLIMLICYLLPALTLGFYMGGTMIRDEQAKTETALLSGMEFSRLLTDQNLSRVVTLARAATYDGELDSAIDREGNGVCLCSRQVRRVFP